VLQNAGHPQDAEGLLRIALDLVPNSVLHHFTLGNVLVSQHRADAAAQSFQTALSIQPNFILAQDSLIDLISQGWLPALDGQPGGGSLLGNPRKALPVDPVHLVQGLPAASQHGEYPGMGRVSLEQVIL
jgi:tetratricopeptide (TPR) repeat protein